MKMRNIHPEKFYLTGRGVAYLTGIEDFLESEAASSIRGKVDLIFFSPPFILNRKKDYGNLLGAEYIEWFSNLAIGLAGLLSEKGSIVVEMGNGWVAGKPVMSTEPLEALLEFKKTAGLHLCQQFIWNNPAKLPSPAQWVNVDRIRVKDNFTNIWWMSKTSKPKADNRNVLVEYSATMKRLLKKKSYNSGVRPSEHVIGEKSFVKDNKGAIPPSVITVANTRSNTPYLNYCSDKEIKAHPARMPMEIPEFFIKFLTDIDDLVFDPFGGSNTTGSVAERLERNWVITEKEKKYLEGSKGHFQKILEPHERKI